MKEIKIKSSLPIYCAAALWIIYCLVFPLYKIYHFLIAAAVAALGYFVFSKIFPGRVELVEVPKEPVTTGDEKIDALLKEGDLALSEFKRLRASIKNESVCGKIDTLMDLTDRIFKDLLEDPSDYENIRRFSNYFIPTTLKLLNAYDRMGETDIEGENISGSLQRIEAILDKTVTAYRNELDGLFANQALDIETDIAVLEGMLKKEGLSGKDF